MIYSDHGMRCSVALSVCKKLTVLTFPRAMKFSDIVARVEKAPASFERFYITLAIACLRRSSARTAALRFSHPRVIAKISGSSTCLFFL